jgi:hypothetical protein
MFEVVAVAVIEEVSPFSTAHEGFLRGQIKGMKHLNRKTDAYELLAEPRSSPQVGLRIQYLSEHPVMSEGCFSAGLSGSVPVFFLPFSVQSFSLSLHNDSPIP